MNLHEDTVLRIAEETGRTVNVLLPLVDELLTSRGVTWTLAVDHTDRAHVQLTPAAAAALRAYHGPGNALDRLDAWETVTGTLTPARAAASAGLQRTHLNDTDAGRPAPRRPLHKGPADAVEALDPARAATLPQDPNAGTPDWLLVNAPSTTLVAALRETATGHEGLQRFVAVVHQRWDRGDRMSVVVAVVDTIAPLLGGSLGETVPTYRPLDGVENLGHWAEAYRAGTHHRLIEYGWMPVVDIRNPRLDRPFGWQRHELGETLAVMPIGGMRDLDGHRVEQGAPAC